MPTRAGGKFWALWKAPFLSADRSPGKSTLRAPIKDAHMTNIIPLRPNHDLVRVCRGRTVPENIPVWIVELTLAEDGGAIIMDSSVKKPSMRDLRRDYWGCLIFVDDDDDLEGSQ